MTTPVKERIQSELEQAKSESKQRAGRIGNILKDAAVLTFDELKGGSAELNVLTRKSLAELLEELKEAEDDTATVEMPTVDAEAVEAEATAEPSLPTWKELITHAIAIVRDRKGDWFQQLKAYLSKNAAKYDADMTEEYGDRYVNTKTKARSLLGKLVAWVEAKAQTNAATTSADSQPVNIEVVDGEVTYSETSESINLPEPKLQDDAV